MIKQKTGFIIGVVTAIFCCSSVQAIEAPDGMVLINAGKYTVGSDKTDVEGRGKEFDSVKPWYLDEHPQHSVTLNAFYMDKYEVTNGEFRKFVASTGFAPPKFWVENGYIVSMKKNKLNKVSTNKLRRLVADLFRIDIDARKLDKAQLLAAIIKHFEELDKLPVTHVSWFGASEYCKWEGKHLPTEAEWESAARGQEGNEFPWGNKFRYGITNTGEQDWPYGVAPVGSYPEDKSAYGVFDMAGNVSEWVSDWYEPYSNSDYKSDAFGQKFKVFRGAAWGGSGHYALQHYQRGAFRLYMSPDAEYEDLGFRCAMPEAKLAKN